MGHGAVCESCKTEMKVGDYRVHVQVMRDAYKVEQEYFSCEHCFTDDLETRKHTLVVVRIDLLLEP